MKQKAGYFESLGGNKSSSRVIGFVVVLIALLETNLVLYLGRDDVVKSAVAAGTLFITIAGPAMAFLFAQKKTEGTQENAKTG